MRPAEVAWIFFSLGNILLFVYHAHFTGLSSHGYMFIGLMINILLFGIMIAQVYVYHTSYKKWALKRSCGDKVDHNCCSLRDSWGLKCFVGSLFVFHYHWSALNLNIGFISFHRRPGQRDLLFCLSLSDAHYWFRYAAMNLLASKLIQRAVRKCGGAWCRWLECVAMFDLEIPNLPLKSSIRNWYLHPHSSVPDLPMKETPL